MSKVTEENMLAYQDLERKLLLLLGEVNAFEKVFSRLWNESLEMQKKLKKKKKELVTLQSKITKLLNLDSGKPNEH